MGTAPHCSAFPFCRQAIGYKRPNLLHYRHWPLYNHIHSPATAAQSSHQILQQAFWSRSQLLPLWQKQHKNHSCPGFSQERQNLYQLHCSCLEQMSGSASGHRRRDQIQGLDRHLVPDHNAPWQTCPQAGWTIHTVLRPRSTLRPRTCGESLQSWLHSRGGLPRQVQTLLGR